jgi:soluble lytic murein transglycosylase
MLGPEARALLRARLAFATDPESAEAALSAVPESLRRDPGLTYQRIKFYREQERDEDAVTLLDKDTAEPHPALWWSERNILARRALDRKDYETAYRLARDRHQTEAAQIADADFLAGWIALRFLNQPSVAAEHFAFMHEHVSSPASKARAAYWRARAAEALGEPDEEWLGRAARYETNFYGQLAAEKLHRAISLPPEPKPTAEDQAEFSRSDLVRAARLLHANTSGPGRAELFLARLGEIEKTPGGQALTARLAREVNAIPLSVTLAKRAAQNNIATLNEGYPVLTSMHVAAPEPALVHAIIRQESLFNVSAVSPAGAIGLMQLMPATANSEARKLNIKHTTSLLSESPAHNVTLGAAYLDDMINNFNGSYVLAIASYNAGPGHVRNWLADNGDPRGSDIDPIDWIELIPIPETRNYVQRVLENTEIYRSRLSGRPVEARLEEDLRR